MPAFLGICGILEIATGMMVLAGAPSVSHYIIAVLLIAFGFLTFGFGAVIYELQLLRRQVGEPGSDPRKSRLW
ncbi:MAG TPA: hypothetical protein VHG92_14705 [Afifellaceae bacterium]|nr:hypothetical protein [Afifellaceae bacterium]